MIIAVLKIPERFWKNPKWQEERVKKFIDGCADKFTKNTYSVALHDLFFDIVCGGKMSLNMYHMDDIDLILSTKENADKFFSFFKDYRIIWHEMHLEHWAEQTYCRYNNWIILNDKIDGYCMKYYGCHWGNQNVTFEEDVPGYKALPAELTEDNYTDYMVNRPLYNGDTFIGYIKDISPVLVTTGYHSEWDEDNDYYPNVPEYEEYLKSIVFYNEPVPVKINGMCFYKEMNKTYLLGNDLGRYAICEDKVILK